jgi:hypothetical protein
MRCKREDVVERVDGSVMLYNMVQACNHVKAPRMARMCQIPESFCLAEAVECTCLSSRNVCQR